MVADQNVLSCFDKAQIQASVFDLQRGARRPRWHFEVLVFDLRRWLRALQQSHGSKAATVLARVGERSKLSSSTLARAAERKT